MIIMIKVVVCLLLFENKRYNLIIIKLWVLLLVFEYFFLVEKMIFYLFL